MHGMHLFLGLEKAPPGFVVRDLMRMVAVRSDIMKSELRTICNKRSVLREVRTLQTFLLVQRLEQPRDNTC